MSTLRLRIASAILNVALGLGYVLAQDQDQDQVQSALQALSADNLSVLAELLGDGLDPNTLPILDSDSNPGFSLAMIAAMRGDPTAMHLLLESGADPATTDANNCTALHWAAGFAANPEVIYQLLRAGSDVNAVCGLNDSTPLLMAAERNPSSLITIALLDVGADLEARGLTTDTPLILAAMHNNAAVVRALIDAGADLDAEGHRFTTALLQAAMRNPDASVVHALVVAGANVEVLDAYSDTPLILAARYNGPDVVATLLRAGANTGHRGSRNAQRALDAALDNPQLRDTFALVALHATTPVDDSAP